MIVEPRLDMPARLGRRAFVACRDPDDLAHAGAGPEALVVRSDTADVGDGDAAQPLPARSRPKPEHAAARARSGDVCAAAIDRDRADIAAEVAIARIGPFERFELLGDRREQRPRLR